jgi:hypothetical protein
MIWAQERAKILKDRLDELFKGLMDGSIALANSAGALTPNMVLASTDTPYRSAFGMDDPENWSRSFAEQQAAIDERAND